MKEHKKSKLVFDRLITILCIFISTLLMYQIFRLGPIEQMLRYIAIGIIIIIDFFIIKLIIKKKRKKIAISILSSFLIIIYSIVSFNIDKIVSLIENMNKEYVTYSTSLITLKDNNYTINNLNNVTIGILSDKNSIDGNILPNEIINEYKLKSKVKIKEYDSYIGLIAALYNKKLDLIFLQGNYIDIFANSEDYPTLAQDTRVLVTKSRDETKESTNLLGSGKEITKPFTILLMGIDSTTNDLKNSDSFNGDSLILVTFNPINLNITMMSIPRDSYVPIVCFTGKIENKITHAAQMGSKCVIDTIENFTGIEIDYYIKINFTGLVDLVDNLGGIDVDVPYNLCEQDSQRRFGKHMIYIEKGLQHLNGEQALALSRNRKTNAAYCAKKWTSEHRDDYIRNENQQKVIKAIIDKVKDISSVSKFYEILDTIAKNVDTNMNRNTILSFYNVAKDILARSKSSSELVTIEQLVLSGIGQTIYDEKSGLELWNHIINKESLKDVINEMKINLNLKEYKMVKDFEFSIKEEYTTPKVGNGPYKTDTAYDLLPDLTKYTKENSISWAKKHNITLKFVETTGTVPNSITKQNYPVNKRLDKIEDRTVTLTIVKEKEENKTTTKIDCLDNNNTNNKKCLLPDFTSYTKAYLTTWGAQFSNIIQVKYIEKESEEEKGTIIEQSIESGTHLKEILKNNKTIIITLAKEITEDDSILPEVQE